MNVCCLLVILLVALLVSDPYNSTGLRLKLNVPSLLLVLISFDFQKFPSAVQASCILNSYSNISICSPIFIVYIPTKTHA